MPIKILITKSKWDVHDRGVRFLASVLRDAGMEVVYTRFGIPEEVVETALQEDVDIIGISLYAGGYSYITSKVMKLLKEKSMDVPVVIGGVIPEDEKEKILASGVDKVFPQSSMSVEIIDYIKSRVASGRKTFSQRESRELVENK